MRFISLLVLLVTLNINLSLNAQVARPKLVIGIVIDQMRWDYLYRYNEIYKPTGGFKRMLGEGFTCENSFIPYIPTVTAAGHSCVYTGSVPAINGIVGNEWYDNVLQKGIYCAQDDSVETVGSSTKAGKMSPRNLLTTTITDELRLATNFKSKSIGIAIKDRGAILPAGHAANGAYWYDPANGNFITSTYYMNELPAWVTAFNNRKVVDSLYKLNWSLFLSKDIYPKYCTEDQKAYESKPLGADQLGFPYNLDKFAGKDYGKIASTPYGNTLTEAMAEAAIKAENLGRNGTTDFLAVSFSSPDYIGHSFGPNSWEQLDDYARLDETLGKLFAFLDLQLGKGNYTAFLTADHGVAHVPNFSKEKKLPGRGYSTQSYLNELNASFKQQYGVDKLILELGSEVVFNNPKIDSAGIDKDAVIKQTVAYLSKQKEFSKVIDLRNLNAVPLAAKEREMIANGIFPVRSGEIAVIAKPGYVQGSGNGTSHGNWNPYDSHIPCVFYGWGIKHGKTNRETYMTDIAATLAGLLKIQMPSGCIGQVIEEMIK